jgi:hypothetical protein
MNCRVVLFFLVLLVVFQFGFLSGAKAIYQDPFITTDEFGVGKFTFGLDEDVYITGGNFKGFNEVTIYVIPTGEDIKPENAVIEPVNATPIVHMSMNPLPTTLIWSAPLEAGEYDIWIDVNQNGQFERYFDDYRIFCCYYMFMVIPEYLVGSVGAVTMMFFALTIYYQSKSAR